MQPTKSQAIKNFLDASTHKDLADLYHLGMECQITVDQGHGERIDGDYKGKQYQAYTDHVTTWKPIRIPYNAASDPEFEDNAMMFDLSQHAEGVGMTGWNWQARQSERVGFDFDAIAGHADAHKGKLTDRELGAVQTAAQAIPWVSVRRSTSGNGLHLYVELDPPIETMNHTEHAAVARSIIGKMSAIVGFDFQAKVDACGGNMWVWHRKMRGTQGLTLIKKGIALDRVDDNWRDHIPVIKGVRAKTVPMFIEESEIPEADKLFDDLTGQRSNTQLDETHRKLIAYLNENQCCAHWDQDRWMLVCHTADLKNAHGELGFTGIFETDTRRGSAQNCFAFPMRKGAWAIRRFTPGVKEHPSWSQDGSGWTQCYYNRSPDLATACKTNDGLEDKSGAFVFRTLEEAVKAALPLGVHIPIPMHANLRGAKLKETKDGRLIVEIAQDNNDNRDTFNGWIKEGNKSWTKIFSANLRQPAEVEIGNYDDLIRHTVSIGGEDCGWDVKSSDTWISEPLQHVKPLLQGALGLTPKEVTAVIGSSVGKPWRLVNKPFKPEYPGDREWNRGAAQLAYHPTENRDDLQYPTWMKVLSHCGEGLNTAIKKHKWCKDNGILNGADYLKVWIASLFQNPYAPLPYLFFYSSQQNTGKSIFHEALTELMTKGVVRADNALTSTANFNGELANAVLATIEEVDLSDSKVAYNRIKDWVTSRKIQVHIKGLTPYDVPNTLHFIQCQPKDTWILTDQGLRQIKDLINKDCTIIYEGQPYRTKGFFRTGVRHTYQLTTKEGFKLRATEEHPILTTSGDLELGSLEVGDSIYLSDNRLNRWEGSGCFEDGYILGWLTGDGNINPVSNQEHLQFCGPDHCHVNSVMSMFPTSPQCNYWSDEFRVSSPYLKELITKYGMSSDKQITEHIQSESADFISGFLSGFFGADAGFDERISEIRLAQSNLLRLEACQRMLAALGIVGDIRACNDSGEYQLIIRKSNVLRFEKQIGFRHPKKAEKLKQAAANQRGLKRQQEDFTVTVESVEYFGEEEVFDITVPLAEHYSANGIAVHNCANSAKFGPLFPGDTRITMVLVQPLEQWELIPKEALLTLLRKEAADFLAEVMHLEIPPSGDRLNLPVIETDEKKRAIHENLNDLDKFITTQVHHVTGRTITFSDFFDAFKDSLPYDPETPEYTDWTKKKVSAALPPHFLKGKSKKDGQMHMANLSWRPLGPDERPMPRFVADGDYITQQSEE